MANKDQLGGVIKQVKGSVKQSVGKATGNKQTQAEGAAEKIAGKIQKGYGDLKETIKSKI